MKTAKAWKKCRVSPYNLYYALWISALVFSQAPLSVKPQPSLVISYSIHMRLDRVMSWSCKHLRKNTVTGELWLIAYLTYSFFCVFLSSTVHSYIQYIPIRSLIFCCFVLSHARSLIWCKNYKTAWGTVVDTVYITGYSIQVFATDGIAFNVRNRPQLVFYPLLKLDHFFRHQSLEQQYIMA